MSTIEPPSPPAPRRPLGTRALRELPLGAVRPDGWLLEQLRLQAAGLTGRLEDVWPDVGPDSAWLGGDGEDWERGPYYLDGLVPLAHLLGDEALLAKAARWVDAILAGQRPDGRFGPTTNDDPWPRMVALKVLAQHADATGDERVVPFLERYLRLRLEELPGRPLESWGWARADDELLVVLWLHERTGAPWLLELADLLVEGSADWEAYLRDLPATGPATTFSHLTHVVNVAMGVKAPAVRHLLDGDDERRRGLEAGLARLDLLHGQVQGTFSGDEWLAGTDPHHGVELCAIVELMFSLEQAVGVFGDGALADRLELLAFNALPAALTADMTAHQYHQQPNQVLCTVADRPWTFATPDANTFGLEPNFGCCTANLHQGWPKLVRAMWMATAEDGLAAVVHGPSRVATTVGGVRVALESRTDYPFGEEVRITVTPEAEVAFPLLLRVPGWCAAPRLVVAGEAVPAEPDAQGFVRVERRWRPGDVVELHLPAELRALPRQRGALGLALGPVVLAHSPGEVWSALPGDSPLGDWEVRFRRAWNVALVLGDGQAVPAARVERRGPSSPPFGLRTPRPDHAAGGVPLHVHVPARRLPGWGLQDASAAPPPPSPAASTLPTHHVALVPYGSARVRIAEFPWVAGA